MNDWTRKKVAQLLDVQLKSGYLGNPVLETVVSKTEFLNRDMHGAINVGFQNEITCFYQLAMIMMAILSQN